MNDLCAAVLRAAKAVKDNSECSIVNGVCVGVLVRGLYWGALMVAVDALEADLYAAYHEGSVD